MHNTFLTMCPVVRRETMRLYERVEVAGKDQMIPFEKEILWVRESSCQVIFRHGGVVVKEGSTTNDYYGYLTSLSGNFEQGDLLRTATKLKITDDSTLSIDLELTIEETPALKDLSPEGVRHNANPNYRRQFCYVPSYGNGGKWWYTSDKPVSDEPYSGWPRLERRVILENPCIYSTLGRRDIGAIPDDLARWIEEQRAEALALSASLPPSPAPCGMGGES